MADDVVRDFGTYAPAVTVLLAPKGKDAEFLKAVGGLGAFPMLAHVGEGEVAIIHHAEVGTANAITKKETGTRVVMGIDGGGVLMEVRGWDQETCGKGKTYKRDTVVRLLTHPEESQTISLTTNSLAIRSFTFYCAEFISLFEGDNNTRSGEKLLRDGVQICAGEQESDEDRATAVDGICLAFEWLANVVRGNAPEFPFRPVVSEATKAWHVGLQRRVLGEDTLAHHKMDCSSTVGAHQPKGRRTTTFRS